MSLHAPSSALPLRRAPSSAVQDSSANPKLFVAVTLLIAVLIADAILISAAAPSVADLASLYVTTT
ncbi:MAG: hypothetical protein WAV27_22540 [Xanthobacteraceae bacterium]